MFLNFILADKMSNVLKYFLLLVACFAISSFVLFVIAMNIKVIELDSRLTDLYHLLHIEECTQT